MEGNKVVGKRTKVGREGNKNGSERNEVVRKLKKVGRKGCFCEGRE